MKKLEIVPHTEEFRGIKNVRLSWAYLHGNLESEVGFDIFGFKDSFMGYTENIISRMNIGITEAVIECEFKGRECLFYLWRNSSHQTGLVVYKNDLEANKYAREKMNEKAEML